LEDPRTVEAAFVYAWEWCFGDKAHIRPDLLENAVRQVRETVPLNRAQAQALLRRQRPGRDARAALVLIYEGIGAHREEEGFVFGSDDIDDMWRVRFRSPASYWDARRVLGDPPGSGG
jgi:hypothetical protein